MKGNLFDAAIQLPTVQLLSYRIFSGDLSMVSCEKTYSTKLLVSTINPHSFYVADHDPEFKKALKESQILLPDGVGIVWANLLINSKRISKISGMDIFLHLLQSVQASADVKKKRIFFLGSTNHNLKTIKDRIKIDFPSLQVDYLSPPFKEEFIKEEIDLMVKRVNDFNPYILFIGITAPRQEKLAFANLKMINATWTCSIGAVFDFYSGKVKRPGILWQRLGLEWFSRFSKEPRRLWRRNLISLPYFVTKVFFEFSKNLLSTRAKES